MRILQVSSPLQLGGGEIHVLGLIEGLRQRGHDVRAAGRHGSAVQPDFEFPFRNAIDLQTVWGLRQLLQRERFDVIHAHVARDYPLVAAAAWGLPGKVVCTRHSLYPVKAHFLYRRVDGWIAPTTQVLETLTKLRPRASAVIPNGIDLDNFEFKPHPPGVPLRLGILGQIAPHKGSDEAIQTLRLLGVGYRLAIAGRGEQGYVQSLKEKSRGLAVEFLGVVSAPKFLENIDVLLVPSWEESFGIVLLEAMAKGVPVIATATGGHLEIIRSGVEGILVPARNPPALAEAIRSLAPLREKIIQNARKQAETEFDIRNIIVRIETFYHST